MGPTLAQGGTLLLMDEAGIIRGSVRFTPKDVLRGLVEMSAALRSRYVILGLILVTMIPSLVTPMKVDLLSPQLVVAAVFLGALFVVPWMRARTTFRAEHLDEGDVEYRLDEEGMTIRLPGRTISAAFRSIYRFRETPTLFLVYTAPEVASAVPKRAFRPTDLGHVRALLSTNVKRARAFPLTLVLIGLIFGMFLFVVVWQFVHAAPAP